MSLSRSFVDLVYAAMQDCKTVGLSVCCGSNVQLVCWREGVEANVCISKTSDRRFFCVEVVPKFTVCQRTKRTIYRYRIDHSIVHLRRMNTVIHGLRYFTVHSLARCSVPK